MGWLGGWRTQDDRWAIRVPTGELPDDYPLVNFSEVTTADKCSVQFPKLSPSASGLYPTVPDELSYAPGTPFDFKTMAKTGAPMVNIQVSTFADFQTIGFVIQHSFQVSSALGTHVPAGLSRQPEAAPLMCLGSSAGRQGDGDVPRCAQLGAAR